MEDEIEELKFEEIDDDFDFTPDEPSEDEAEAEIKPVEDHFTSFYTPIRTVFANDSKLLEKFSSCKCHEERLKLLLEQNVVKTSLLELYRREQNVIEENLPTKPETEPKPWKELPKLSYGPHKKFPHFSKALEVRIMFLHSQKNEIRKACPTRTTFKI